MFIGYMVADFRCGCGDPIPTFDRESSGYRCANCGAEVLVHRTPFSSPAVRRMEIECERVVSAIMQENDCLSAELADARNLVQEVGFGPGAHDAEMERLRAELLTWKKDAATLKRRISGLEAEISDMKEAASHLRGELSRSIRPEELRDVVEVFIDYASNLYNASIDKDDPEKLREQIRNRTDYLSCRLSRVGAHVHRHERGEELGDGRMDIIPVPTDDRELDGRVAKSETFGCRFDSDDVPEIPEVLRVYSFCDASEAGERTEDGNDERYDR